MNQNNFNTIWNLALIEGIVDKIIVSPVLGETREGKDTQRGHMFNIKFKLPIVNDSIEYKNEQNKSDGYSIKDGNKESIVDQGLNLRGKGKKKIHQIWCTYGFIQQ